MSTKNTFELANSNALPVLERNFHGDQFKNWNSTNMLDSKHALKVYFKPSMKKSGFGCYEHFIQSNLLMRYVRHANE